MLAFAIVLSIEWGLSRGQAMRFALDRPNERSLHDQPVPRTGGLGVHLGILLICPFVAPEIPTIIWMITLGLLVISFADDLRGLPALTRLTAHIAGSGIFASVTIYPAYGLTIACVTTLGLTWLINLYNFMDGADGLAGGMTFFGFSFYGSAALLADNPEFAIMNFSIAAAAAGFLIFNFHPARIFLGDAGSVPLGFLAGVIGLRGWQLQLWTWWFPLLVFSPFIVDASVTLARRICVHARVWEAHRDHYYQRLIRMGWSHRRTALAAYVLMVACGLAGLIGLHQPLLVKVGLLATALFMYAAIIHRIERAWHRHQSGRRNAS